MAVGVITKTGDAEGQGASKRKMSLDSGDDVAQAASKGAAGVIHKTPTSPVDAAPSVHDRVANGNHGINGVVKNDRDGSKAAAASTNGTNSQKPTLTDTSTKDINGTNAQGRASSSMHYSIIDEVGAGASGSSFMDEGILTSADSGDPHSLYGSFTWKVPKFKEVSKRELKSSSFSVGPYKWYILVYPNGCDVSNHLSLFLCVADYDKLLPGWSHFAQFTIAVVNKDPKKSKYSDTLHRFCKKEHDWGWKKFMELGKMEDGFVVSDTLVIKVQVQVIKDRMTAPFRTLDCHYRRELIRVYLSNIEGIVRKFIDKTKEKVRGLLKGDNMVDFWESISQKEKLKLSSTPAAPLLKKFTKAFFNEKEVTSTLMMDAAFCAMKVMDCRHMWVIQGKNIPNSEEESDKEDYVNPLERYIRSINESWHSLHLDGSKGVFKFEKMDFVSPIDALAMFIEPIWMGNLRYIEVNDNQRKKGGAGAGGNAADGAGNSSSGMPTSTKGLVDLNLTMFTEEKCFTLPGEMDELKLVTAARLTLEAFAMEHIAEQIESARKEAEIIRMQEELIREEEEAHKDKAAKKAKQAEVEREKKAKKAAAKKAKLEAERAAREAEAERKAREEEQKRQEKERQRLELEEKRRKEEAEMEAERQKLLLEREREMKLETARREKERLEKQQQLLFEKAERERKLEKERLEREKLRKIEREKAERELKREKECMEREKQLERERLERQQRDDRQQEIHSNTSDHSRQDSLDGSIAALSDHSGPMRTPSLPTSPVKAGGVSVSAQTTAPVAVDPYASNSKTVSALKALLLTRDEEIERLKLKVSSLETDLESALKRLSRLSSAGQKKSAPSTPSQNISNMSQQHMASHAYILQQMAMNPSESILGVSSSSQVGRVETAGMYGMYGGGVSRVSNNPQTSPARVDGVGASSNSAGASAAAVSPEAVAGIGVAGVGAVDGVSGVGSSTNTSANNTADDFDSAFAHLGLVESLLD